MTGNKTKIKTFIFIKYNNLKQSINEFTSHTILFFALVLLIVSVLVLILAIQRSNYQNNRYGNKNNKFGSYLDMVHRNNLRNTKCNFISCFDIYRCGNVGKDLFVYIYPEALEIAHTNNMTKEFHTIIQFIHGSKYYTSNPNKACIYIPSIDTLSSRQRKINTRDEPDRQRFFNAGRNHLIFNIERKDARTFKNNSDNLLTYAMIADVSYTKSEFRKEFDISLPTWSDSLKNFQSDLYGARNWFVTSSQLNIDYFLEKDLAELAVQYSSEVRILHNCSHLNEVNLRYRCYNHNRYRYPDVLKSSTFCLISRGEKSGLSILLEALAAQCIPVVINDAVVMPFSEVIDWSRAAVFVREASVMQTVDTLRRYSSRKLDEYRRQGTWLYSKYFKTIDRITETVFEIILDRIYPHFARNYQAWNEADISTSVPFVPSPSAVSKNNGFTAVVLTYDRVDSLFTLLEKLAKIPSLVKILVIWNNEYKLPPRSSKWPKISKPMKVLHTEKNLLSNRFYPYQEIETEAVLSIDDDILMLTEDEIEFAYEVWKEFPDRIVGFPSRMHVWDNKTNCWKYESEWTNHISMVLTGAAFYHKYWNYAYTIHLPESVKEWVDYYMNCEDIAMNFLVSNMTNKAPIKVTAKKKFRCPECVSTEMLSADSKHMIQRSECVNKFSSAFGRIPLIPVEFRADPVLYKDSFPDKLKRFNNVGNL
ncbi:exostosin-2 [Phymastichus coffea]|uniref:exostosin-2 n=1 Tax=Phymastichus coffea TaxID=108790 RepID=UPI00273BDD44|nr:exostosin-2 [Phymastichus coffea]